MKVEDLLADLGISVDPAKSSVLQSWNGKLTALETDSQSKLSAAQKQLEDAQALQSVIDQNIESAGLTENNVAQLQANNAALAAANASLTAAVENIRKQGFTGLEIPDLPSVQNESAPDPMKELTNMISKGFSQVGQTINEMNRYQRAFGAPLPEDPATIADRAAKSNLSVHDYVDRTYKVSAKEQEIAQASKQKELDGYAATKLEEYKAAHPNTSGNPDLAHGVPSNYPSIPAPRGGKSLQEFSQLSAHQKIADAMQRVTADVNARNSAA